MLGILNILDIAFAGVVAFTDVQLANVVTVKFPERNHLVAVEFRPATAFWNKTYPCRYHGLLVPYVRDWEEEVGGFESKTILPPEPDKLAGYAVVINKLICPNEEPQFVFNVGQFRAWRPGTTLVPSYTVTAYGLRPNPDLQPKWLPQVTKAIEDAAATNADARGFLVFSQSAKEKAAAKQNSIEAGSGNPTRTGNEEVLDAPPTSSSTNP